jgi:hypothetical protein
MKSKNTKLTGYLPVLGMMMSLFSSCLKHGLPAYPLYGQDYINKVYFEYRWLDSNNVSNGQPVVAVENLNVTQEIDSVNNIISCQITVPAASGDFDTYQRSLVTLDSIWAYADLSPAASVTPVGNAPVFSYQGNYSIPQKYLVAAANPDSTRVWTIQVTSFSKP